MAVEVSGPALTARPPSSRGGASTRPAPRASRSPRAAVPHLLAMWRSREVVSAGVTVSWPRITRVFGDASGDGLGVSRRPEVSPARRVSVQVRFFPVRSRSTSTPSWRRAGASRWRRFPMAFGVSGHFLGCPSGLSRAAR